MNAPLDQWQIIVVRTGQRLATRAAMASTWLARMQGLLGRQSLEVGQALILPRCTSIHTWGMRCAMDAVFVDRRWRVVALQPALAPWRMVGPLRRAWGVVEAGAGTVQRLGLERGDSLLVVAEGAA